MLLTGSCTDPFNSLSPAARGLNATAMFFSVCLSVLLFVCSLIASAAAATKGVPCVSSLVEKLHREICGCGGGLPVASRNAPHLFYLTRRDQRKTKIFYWSPPSDRLTKCWTPSRAGGVVKSRRQWSDASRIMRLHECRAVAYVAVSWA